MLHTILPSYNNVVGWAKAASTHYWGFHNYLLLIQKVNNKNDSNTSFRCLLKLKDTPKDEDKNEFVEIFNDKNYYKIIGCYKTPEEAFDAAIKELEWTELQFLPGVPSDYYAPYQ